MEEAQIEKTLEVIRQALEAGRVNDAMQALVLLHPADRADAFWAASKYLILIED